MTKKIWLIHIACFAFFAIIANVGWSAGATPKCSAKQVTQFVLSHYVRVFTFYRGFYDVEAIEIKGIRTQSINKSIRKVECTAQMIVPLGRRMSSELDAKLGSSDGDPRASALIGMLRSTTIPINYSAQYTDDGSDIVVSIYK